MAGPSITIIGGGLAGSEAAFQAARLGARVMLYEMKPRRFSPAHTLATLGELVCSNSLKAVSLENSSGLLKEEMRMLGSLVIRAAEATSVPAGGTLAVDRERFSAFITEELGRAGVEVVREEVTKLPGSRPLVIATGPLTSDALAGEIARATGGAGRLHFYDAVAPIVYRDSIDMTRAFEASRWGRGGADYINCPLGKDDYDRFITALVSSDRAAAHDFEDLEPRYFEGCMPVEVMAERGPQTLSFGPMRPVGIIDPVTGKRPHAVVQLRRENSEGTLYNMVGFQTRLRYPDQKRVFRMIPGLENAEFARLGKMHRNTFIDSPRLINSAQQLEGDPSVFFAGQITGVEGYSESAASGLLAGINAWLVAEGRAPVTPPPTTMTGALLYYISSAQLTPFQPMNSNFGLLPGLSSPDGRKVKKKERKALYASRALSDLREWLNDSLECCR